MTQAEVDVGLGFDIGAHIDAAVGKLARAFATEFQRAEQQRLQLIPNPITFEGLLAPGVATTVIWDCGTPQSGRRWELRLLSVDAQPDGSNTSNFVLLVGVPTVPTQIGGPITGFPAGNILTTSHRWRFNQAPNSKDFSGSQIVVRPGQHLMIAALAAPALTNVSFVIGIDDMPDQTARGAVAVV